MIEKLNNIVNAILYLTLAIIIDIICIAFIKSFMSVGGIFCVCIALAMIAFMLYINGYLFGKMMHIDEYDLYPTPNDFNGNDALGCMSGKVVADEITRGIQK